MSKVITVNGIGITNKTPVEIKAMIVALTQQWNDTLLPNIITYSTLYKNIDYKSQELKEINSYLLKTISSRETNWSSLVLDIMENFNLSNFTNAFSKHFENGIDVDSLTIRDSAYIALYDQVKMFSDYSVNLILYMLSIEQETDTELNTPLRVKYINDYLSSYAFILKEMNKRSKGAISECDSQPDDYIASLPSDGKNNFNVDNAVGMAKLVTGIVAATGTLAIAAYRFAGFLKWRINGGSALVVASGIQRNKETKRLLELKIIAYKNQASGKNDAALENTIRKIEARIISLDSKIAEAEKRYGL